MIVLLVLVAFGILAWQFRPAFYLWRMGQTGFVPRGLALSGDSGLKSLYRAVDRLNERSEPRWSESLASALQEVRFEKLAKARGNALLTRNAATLAPVNEDLAHALQQCFHFCTDPIIQRELLTSLTELDFNQKARFFCDVFEVAEGDSKLSLSISYFESLLALAYSQNWENPEDYFGEGSISSGKMAETQEIMRQNLKACVLPIGQKALRKARSKFDEEHLPDWAPQIERALTQYASEDQGKY